MSRKYFQSILAFCETFKLNDHQSAVPKDMKVKYNGFYFLKGHI